MSADGLPIGGQPAGGAGHWLNGERIRVYSWMIVVIFAAILLGWIGLSLPDLVDPRGKPIGYDFMSYWSAARHALDGRPEAAFDGAAITLVQHQAVPFLPNIWFPWHYPPIFLLVVAPLGLIPYPAALASFVVGTAALWAALVRCVLTDRRAWIVAAAAPAGLINLIDGQNAFLTASLAGFALLWLDRRPLAAGVLIGLLAVKPHLAVLFPLALVAEGRWRSIAAAAVTVLALAAASLLAFGWGSWAIFLHHLPITQAMADQGAVPWGTMPSPYVFALSFGAPVTLARALQAVVALSAGFCVWRAWRNPRAPFEAKAATLLAGSLLVSPYLFYYDLLWAALAAGWLALLGIRSGFHRGEREMLVFAWLAPAAMQPVHALTAVQLGFPAVVLLFAVAVRRAAPLTESERSRLHRALDAMREARWLTRERVLRWGVGFLVMSVSLVVLQILRDTGNGLIGEDGQQLGADFVNYWSGARFADGSRAALAYDIGVFDAFQKSIFGAAANFKMYVYPPLAMMLTWPLAKLPYVAALIAWVALGAGLCLVTLSRLLDWRLAALATFAAPAAILNLLTGQNGYFTAALLGGALIVLGRRPVAAGILFGLLSYKPHLGILLPAALIAGREWRAFAAAAATVAVLVGSSVVLLGADAWAAFFHQLSVQTHVMEIGQWGWHRIPTVFVALRIAGAGNAVAYAAQIASSLAALVLVVLVWRRDCPPAIKAATVVVAAFLAVPYAQDYDMVVLVFAAGWLLNEALATGFLPWERIILAMLLVLPIMALPLSKLAGVQPGPVVLWAVLVVLARRGLASRPLATRLVVPGATGAAASAAR